MIVREINSKTILSVSKIHDYVVNPYVGCAHACRYCYARFMKRFTGHGEPWGEFVDVKVNAASLLLAELKKKRRGSVWISGVCDPYQPLEKKYGLTRRCLEILADAEWPVVIQTRSPLVRRDMDVFKGMETLEVGFSITTADDEIRKLFEPNAPPVGERLKALDELHRAGITTYAMIAPMLPGAEGLTKDLAGKVDYVLVDRMNYNHADWVYRKHNLMHALSEDFFKRTSRSLVAECRSAGIDCRLVY